MNKFLFVLLVLFILPACSCKAAARYETDFSHIVKMVAPSIGYVDAYDKANHPIWHGSGSIIGDHTLLTAKHVLSNFMLGKTTMAFDHATFRLPDGRKLAVSNIKRAISCDIAFGTLVGDNLPTSLPFALDNPAVGTPVCTLGYPLEYSEQVFQAGWVSSYCLNQISSVRPAMMFSIPIYPGHSGSPVLDAQGCIVSIVSNRDMRGEHLNSGPSLTDIRNAYVAAGYK